MAVVGSSAETLAAALDRRLEQPAASPAAVPRVAFVFSGQGSHWPGMARDLYEREPVFRAALDECDRAILALSGRSTVEEIARPPADSRMSRTDIAQPAAFAVQVSLAALWRAWGIEPALVAGHSLGEVAAACASGSLTVADGARIVCARSSLMTRVAGRGATAVVGLPLDETRRAIAAHEPAVTVAGSNGPRTTVIAGDAHAVIGVTNALDAQGVFCRAVAGVDIAFHSAHMDPLRGELVASLEGLIPGAGAIPMVSTVTADIVDGPGLDARYWGRNLREPFLFTQATRLLLERECTTLVEIAAHPVLGSSMVQTIRASAWPETRVLGSLRRDGDGAASMYAALAALYEAGASIRWEAVYQGRGRVTTLPAYPWQRRRYWLDQLSGRTPHEPHRTAGDHPLLGPRVDVAGADGRALHVWPLEVRAQDPAFIADHRVNGAIVWPGAAAIEMARAAAAQVWTGEKRRSWTSASNASFVCPNTAACSCR